MTTLDEHAGGEEALHRLEERLPDDEPFREAVRSHLEFGSRVAQQNSRAETEADLHPLRTRSPLELAGELRSVALLRR